LYTIYFGDSIIYVMERITVAEARKRGLLKTQKSKSKYGNKRTFYNGRWYDSQKESLRAVELDMLLKSGVVKKWTPQVRYDFTHNGVKICTYVLDFKIEYSCGKIEYEDVKGFKTAIYKLKKKMMKAFYQIEIKET